MRLAAVALAVAACSSREPHAGRGSAADPGSAAQTSSRPAALVVDAPGQEPRRIVHYQIGHVERTIELVVSNDGPWPVAAQTLAWTCAPPAACTYQLLRFEAAGNDTAFAGITKEVHGDVKVTPDGTAEITKANMFANLTPSPEELIDLGIVKFPTVPIGVGAGWHVDGDDRHTLFVLTQLTDSGATVGISFEQSADQARLTGEGELVVSFSDPLARGRFDEHQLIVLDPSLGVPANRYDVQLELR